MDHRGGDDLLERVIGELRELPPQDESRVSRIVAAARAAEREPPADEDVVPLTRRRRWFSGVPAIWAAGIAVAAGVGGFMLGGARDDRPIASRTVAESVATPSQSVVPVSAASGELAPRLTQFVLEAPRAGSVSLVGDFNGWDAKATPLVRDPASGIWSATIALTPGRHVYAFMVDSIITLDPRAQQAIDPDLGTRSSVVLVGGGR